jgi:ribosomal subunit interface protein
MLKIVLTTEKFELEPELQKYAQKKLNGLERYVPKSARESAHIEVRFKQENLKNKKHSTCELTLHLPHENLFARETTQHMYAAVDIAAAHIREQIVSYKAKHTRTGRRRLGRNI